jgi:hypothetical protein
MSMDIMPVDRFFKLGLCSFDGVNNSGIGDGISERRLHRYIRPLTFEEYDEIYGELDGHEGMTYKPRTK